MANNLVCKLDLISVNDDGTIDVIDLSNIRESPINYTYRLYLPFKENQETLFKPFTLGLPVKYEYTQRLFKYLENRAMLYDDVSKKYYPTVKWVLDSKFSTYDKTHIIDTINLALNRDIYPYKK